MNDSFDTLMSRNASLIEAYYRMKSGVTHQKSKRHEVLCEKTLTDAQSAKRDEIVNAMKGNADDFKKKYGNDWESVMYATATKQALTESNMLSEGENESNSLFMPKEVQHKRVEEDDIHSHLFEPSADNLGRVEKHLKSLGFKPAGLPDNYGRHTETKYTHPSGMDAYIGHYANQNGYLDVTNK